MFSIIIPTYVRGDLAKTCVESIIENKKLFRKVEIILIANGEHPSVIKTADYLDSKYPKFVRCIRLPQNIGYGPALNVGLAQAKSKYIVFLNDDTLASYGWDEELFMSLQDKAVGCVGIEGCRLKVENGSYTFDKKVEDNFHYLEGWFLAGRREVFKAVSGMSEEFGLAFSEDADFSFKIEASGHGLKKIPPIFNHIKHQTVSFLPGTDWIELVTKNNQLLYDKWFHLRGC